MAVSWDDQHASDIQAQRNEAVAALATKIDDLHILPDVKDDLLQLLSTLPNSAIDRVLGAPDPIARLLTMLD